MQPMPDIAALLKIAQSPAGQKLLAILRSSNTSELDTITAAATAGNLEEAKQKLAGILATEEARELLSELEKSL